MVLPEMSDYRDNNDRIVLNHEALFPSGQRLTFFLSVWLSPAANAAVGLNNPNGFPLKSHPGT
jgi:hypothetical protein